MRRHAIVLAAAAVAPLILSTCQPAMSPEELLRVGDRLDPTIVVTSHQYGDPFAEPATTVVGTITDLAREDGTAGRVRSASWSAEGSAAGGNLSLGDGGAFTFQVDTQGRPFDLVLNFTAEDWNGNTETLRFSLAVPKEMVSFAFETAHNSHLPFDAAGAITGTSISVPVGEGTVVTDLIATFTATGTSVKVAGNEQQSGVTVHDFSVPVVYSVTGRDNRTKDFAVTVVQGGVEHGAAAAPAFDPAPGTYDHDIEVALSTTNPGSSVFYFSTDGSAPTSGSQAYLIPIPVAGHGTTATIRAATYAPGFSPSEASGTYTISYPAPAPPSGLVVSALSVGKLHLVWTDNSTSETGFIVERSPDGNTLWEEKHETLAGVTTWDDVALVPGATYYYRVRATNAGSVSAPCSVSSAATEALLPIAFVTIASAGDSFEMGDGTWGPLPTVVTQTISYSYKLSKYEVTNGLFAQFIADGGYTTSGYWTTNGWNYKESQGWTQPYWWTDELYNGPNQPVVGVSWYEVVAFCNWRAAKEGLTKAYSDAGQAALTVTGWRLPTEVEWEYAAAKGASVETERIYAYGSTWDETKVVCNFPPASPTRPANVGSKSPDGDTPHGLCDISGNVWEWCSDNWQDDAFVTSGTNRYYFVDDQSSTKLLLRGGAWSSGSEVQLRCAYRNYGYNGALGRDGNERFGFRLCRP